MGFTSVRRSLVHVCVCGRACARMHSENLGKRSWEWGHTLFGCFRVKERHSFGGLEQGQFGLFLLPQNPRHNLVASDMKARMRVVPICWFFLLCYPWGEARPEGYHWLRYWKVEKFVERPFYIQTQWGGPEYTLHHSKTFGCSDLPFLGNRTILLSFSDHWRKWDNIWLTVGTFYFQ